MKMHRKLLIYCLMTVSLNAELTQASVKIRGGGGDFNYRLIQAKSMAVEMIESTAQPDVLCPSFPTPELCQKVLGLLPDIIESLKASSVYPATSCFLFDENTKVLKNLGHDFEEVEDRFCFDDYFPNNKMMTFHEVGSPIFINAAQSIDLDLGVLAKLFIHETFHHFGISDDYSQGVQNNLPDLASEIIYSLALAKRPELIGQIVESKNFYGPGIANDQSFEFIWASVDRGEKSSWGNYKANDRDRLSGLFSPAPEFFVDLALCNRSLPIRCETLVSFRENKKVIRKGDETPIQLGLEFSGEDLNRAYHKIHGKVWPSGDPRGHDLVIRLVEDDLGIERFDQVFASGVIPLETLYGGNRESLRSEISDDQLKINHRATGASAIIEIIQLN